MPSSNMASTHSTGSNSWAGRNGAGTSSWEMMRQAKLALMADEVKEGGKRKAKKSSRQDFSKEGVAESSKSSSRRAVSHLSLKRSSLTYRNAPGRVHIGNGRLRLPSCARRNPSLKAHLRSSHTHFLLLRLFLNHLKRNP
jgi:hypothetical protein